MRSTLAGGAGRAVEDVSFVPAAGSRGWRGRRATHKADIVGEAALGGLGRVEGGALRVGLSEVEQEGEERQPTALQGCPPLRGGRPTKLLVSRARTSVPLRFRFALSRHPSALLQAQEASGVSGEPGAGVESRTQACQHRIRSRNARPRVSADASAREALPPPVSAVVARA